VGRGPNAKKGKQGRPTLGPAPRADGREIGKGGLEGNFNQGKSGDLDYILNWVRGGGKANRVVWKEKEKKEIHTQKYNEKATLAWNS